MKERIALSALAVLTAGVVPVYLAQAEEKVLKGAELRTMVQNLGYTVKDLNTEVGKEKVSVKITQGGLDVPVAAEVSPSTRFVWLTVFLGEAPATGFDAKALGLLKQNTKIQPSFFYLTDKNGIMMALAVDNRNITPAVLRHRMDKIVQDVVDTKSFWQN